MPPGMDDYNVVIGAEIADHTAIGAASVRGNVSKMSADIRQYGDKQAREFARNSRTLFNQTDQHVTRSASIMVKRLTYIFDQNNFLLRQLARQAGSTTGAIAIGVGKLALSYGKLGKDTEEASHRAKVALEDIKSSVSRLGTDPSAFPAALKSTRDLSSAYEAMGKSGHAASVKAGGALEDIVHKRLITLQGGLQKAQLHFEKLRIGAGKDSEAMSEKINEISASVRHLLGGAPVDAPFFKSFIKARTENEKFILVNEKLGARAAVAYASHQKEIEKLAGSFSKLEARSSKAIKTEIANLSKAATSVQNYTNEIAGVEKALVGAAGGTTELATATGGLSGAMAAGGIALGIFLAVALLVIAAVAALTFLTYKGASTAAKYGDEIYKLSLSTGLTVKTLSALSIIAKETNTDVDSLAKTFTRTQIQIQRGLDKPLSEAGRALRTLKVNFQELRKANPDQQIFTLAKAFTELNNQNVRATVSQQLFSRDAERQAKMLEQIATSFEIAQKKAKKYGLELDESGAIKSHLMTVAIADMSLAWEGLWVSLGIKILPQLTVLMENFTEWVLKSGGAFDFTGNMIGYALRGLRIWIELIKETGTINPVFNAGYAWAGGLDRAAETVDKQDMVQFKEYQKRIAELKKRGLQGDDQYAAGKGPKSPKSELERLEDRVKRLRFEISALQDMGSKRFFLRFELENLEKVKQAYETIFKLRNEMGLVLNSPLPSFFQGTEKEDLANIQSYIKQMERMKTIFDGVRKVANEQGDALAELAQVQQEALMPVVDAGILAEIKYYTAIRDRAKAERELTADVIAETKLRKEAIEDEVGSTLKAYNTLRRDLGRSQDTIRDQRTQDDLFIRILKGDNETEAGIRAGIMDRMGSTAVPIVPSELMAIAAHAATIDLNVASIAEKIGANVHNVSNTTVNSPGSQTGYATSSLVRRNVDGTVTVVSQQGLNNQNNTADGIDIERSQTTDPGYLRKRIFDESRNRAGAERSAAVRKANQEIIDNEMRMEQALIDIDTDYLANYKTQQIARRAEARGTTISIMLLENDLRDLENVNSELYKQTWEEANQSRLNDHAALKANIIGLQNDIANNGFDQADREKKAYLQSIRDIQEASNQARESIIYNQVKIADATVYHADIANAKVTEFLANQRSITEVIADAKVGMIDSTFSSIDQALDRFTSKLVIAGDLVKSLLSGFLRLALTPFFRSMQGPGNGSGGGIFSGIPNVGGGGTGGSSFSFGGGNALFSNSFGGGGGASIGVPGSVSDIPRALNPQQIAAMTSGMPPVLAGAQTGSGLSALFGAQGGLASMLPLLGLSLGATLGSAAGGSSKTGRALGMIGGAGVGGALGLLAFTALGGTFASPALVAALGILGPAALIGGPALIAAAIILGRNSARRRDETERNTTSNDTGTAIWALIERARSGDLTASEANSEWARIAADYASRTAQLKDKKTRRNAELQWINDFLPLKKILDTNVAQAEKARTASDSFVPTFAQGGFGVIPGGSHLSRGLHQIPGRFDMKDDQLIGVSRGESIAVMDPSQFQRMGGHRAFSAAGIPRFQSGMVMTPTSDQNTSKDTDGDIIIQARDGISEELLNLLIGGLTTPQGKKLVVKAMDENHKKKGMQGNLGVIARGVTGGRI